MLTGSRLPLLRLTPHLMFLATPWLVSVGLSWVITVCAIAYFTFADRSNGFVLLVAMVAAGVTVALSPYIRPVGIVTYSAVLVSLHLWLLLVSPWLKATLEPARNSWVLHLSYLAFFLMFVLTDDIFPKAAMQICIFTYLAYISLYSTTRRTVLRDFWSLVIAAIGSARAILVGFVLGRILTMRYAGTIRVLACISVLGLVVMATIHKDEIITLLTGVYEGLKAAGYLLKGRTSYALALLGSTSGVELFGSGAGFTMRVMLSSFSDQNQIHNDVLRTLVDYGLIPLLAVIAILLRQFFFRRKGLIVVAMFAVFMTTGNVLSYASVIFPLMFTLCRERSGILERHNKVKYA